MILKDDQLKPDLGKALLEECYSDDNADIAIVRPAPPCAILATQLSDLTGGQDGRSFRVPELLRTGVTIGDSDRLAMPGRVMAYYRVFGAALALFLGALRIVNSPFGRVLQAIATTMLRGSARLPHRHLSHRRHLAGGRHGDPTLSFTIMIDILLMTVIGGMGTIYGAAVAATLFLLAQN